MPDYPLKVCERSRDNQLTHGVVIHDYTDNATLCRRGVWVGSENHFEERVVLCWEHGDAEFNVFWRFEAVWTQGFGPKTQTVMYAPSGNVRGSVARAPGIDWHWPHQGIRHQIAFTSAPGAVTAMIRAKVLYQDMKTFALHDDGPEQVFTITGREVVWPKHKLNEERECKQRWSDTLRDYVTWRDQVPGAPMPGLDDIRGPQALELNAMVKELERLGPEDAEIKQAIEAELSRRLLEAELRERARFEGESAHESILD